MGPPGACGFLGIDLEFGSGAWIYRATWIQKWGKSCRQHSFKGWRAGRALGRFIIVNILLRFSRVAMAQTLRCVRVGVALFDGLKVRLAGHPDCLSHAVGQRWAADHLQHHPAKQGRLGSVDEGFMSPETSSNH